MKCSDEISIGEYVRTDKGIITKAQEHFIDGLLNGKSAFGKAVKHSFDIIDLLEDDDFIIIEKNGYPLQIRTIWENGGELNIRLSNEMIFEDIKNDKEFDIKSILTKEQFEANVYKLEER